jgi:hypothetical protein
VAPAKALADLALEKRLLLAESEACRVALSADLHHVTAPLRWVERLQTRSRSWLLLAAPIAGLLLARRLPRPARWATSSIGVLPALRLGLKLVRLLRGR